MMKTLRIPLVIVIVLAVGRTFNAGAQTETNLYSFGGSPGGCNPPSGLVQGSDSNFYGTTYGGGMYGSGTVFRISASGTCTTLYSFGKSSTDGSQPNGLVQGSDGYFYGTTYEGGTNDNGTVFRVSPGGTCTTLYHFVGYPDGNDPEAGLVQGSDGNFYGAGNGGGTYAGGTVFRISPSGTYTTLYSFGSSLTDGGEPNGLVQGSDGNFYGTTYEGGTNDNGTVFRISPSGSETILYYFVGGTNDGRFPYAGLVQGSDGNFYGTTHQGGTNDNGTVFRVSPGGSEMVLHHLVGGTSDGELPYAGLVQGSDGNFYGTAGQGGTNDDGTAFRVSPSGAYATLHSFAGSPTDGAAPFAGLIQASDGNFYGTTYSGGTGNSGTVYRLTVSLNPPPWPINQITSVHIAATSFIFNIPSIAGETYQLQYRSSMNGIWSNVPAVSVTNSIGSILTLTNFAGGNQLQGFYRFAITP
jgi:uncharacterized repeat protein (TIGR03803 family)